MTAGRQCGRMTASARWGLVLLSILCGYLLLWTLTLAGLLERTAAERDLWKGRAVGMKVLAGQCIAHDAHLARKLQQCERLLGRDL